VSRLERLDIAWILTIELHYWIIILMNSIITEGVLPELI
jgi:hypothetical protein